MGMKLTCMMPVCDYAQNQVPHVGKSQEREYDHLYR